MEVGLGPDHTVLGGDPAPPKRGTVPNFRLTYCGQTAGGIKMPLGKDVDLGPGDIVLYGDPVPPKGQSPQFSAHVYCGQTFAHLSYC